MSARDEPRDDHQIMVALQDERQWGQEDDPSVNILTTDDSRKEELRTELDRSRQEAVAGKACSSSRS